MTKQSFAEFTACWWKKGGSQ